MWPYFIITTVLDPNLFSLARLPSRKHFPPTDVSVCTYVKWRVNTQCERMVICANISILGCPTLRSPRRESTHSVLHQSLSRIRALALMWFCKRLYCGLGNNLHASTRRREGLEGTSRKHAEVSISRLESPSLITLPSWLY